MAVENQSSQRSISRRDILKLAGAIGGGAMLAACAPPPAPQAGDGPEMAEPIELEISVLQGAPVESVNELIKAAFTEQHPDVTVTFNFVSGDLAEKYYTAAAAGTLSDVFFSADLFVVPFANNGVTLDLGPYIEGDADIDIDDVFENMLGLGIFDGKIQMLPSALDVVTMYYNKTLFEEAGAELPTDQWTWEDFIVNCQKITALETEEDGTPRFWGLANGTWNWWATVYPWVVGHSGTILDMENNLSTWSDPNTLEGLAAYAALWNEHNIAQPLGLDVGGNAFFLGRAAVFTHIQSLRGPVREAATDKFDWDVQVMPLMPDGRHRTGMGTWGMSAYADGQNLDMAYEYIKQLIRPSVQLESAKAELGVPLLKSVANDSSWMEGLPTPPTNLMAFINGADDAILPVIDHPGDCGSFYAGMVSDSYRQALEAVIRGQATAEEAFAETDATIQACLDQNA